MRTSRERLGLKVFETCLTEQIYPKLFALSTTKYTLPFFSTSIYLSKLCKFRGDVEKIRCLCELEGLQLLSTPAKEPFGEREEE